MECILFAAVLLGMHSLQCPFCSEWKILAQGSFFRLSNYSLSIEMEIVLFGDGNF